MRCVLICLLRLSPAHHKVQISIPPAETERVTQALLDVLPELLTGAEFGAARLIVASLDPDLDEPVAVPAGSGAHG